MEESVSQKYEKTVPCKGLYSIMPIDNIPSVLKHGLLSNKRANSIGHSSIALEEVQDRRENVRVPNGLELHDYANLYFDPRNPMMYRRKEEAKNLCVLRVSFCVLEKDDVVVSDRNASRGNVLFCTPSEGLAKLDFNVIYAKSWVDNDPYVQYEKKGKKCAEVLVPYQIAPEFINAAFVVDLVSKRKLLEQGFNREVIIKPDLFFA